MPLYAPYMTFYACNMLFCCLCLYPLCLIYEYVPLLWYCVVIFQISSKVIEPFMVINLHCIRGHVRVGKKKISSPSYPLYSTTYHRCLRYPFILFLSILSCRMEPTSLMSWKIGHYPCWIKRQILRCFFIALLPSKWIEGFTYTCRGTSSIQISFSIYFTQQSLSYRGQLYSVWFIQNIYLLLEISTYT